MLGHDIVYCKNGFSPVLETDFQTIAKSQPQLILVAMGCPKQDEFIYSLSNHLNSGVAIGVGGSFDVWSGLKPRAPFIFRFFGFEWLYRILLEPQRFSRLIRCFIKPND